MKKRVGVVAAVFVAALTVGCSGASDEAGSPGTGGQPSTGVPAPAAAPGTASDHQVPPSVGDDAGAGDPAPVSEPVPVLVSAGELGLTDEQRACVAVELGEPFEGPRPIEVLEPALAVCGRALVFGPVFVQQLEQDNPGVYSAEQLACVAREYSALDPEVYDSIIVAGLYPESESAVEADQALEGVFESCGAARPR